MHEGYDQTKLAPQEVSSAGHLEELRRRVLGYSFGSPVRGWCEAGADLLGIVLPEDPSSPEGRTARFKGCLKYATCNIIPDSLRWRAWSELSAEEQKQLLSLGCYRATGDHSAWNTKTFKSRQVSPAYGHWVGNPFGIRTENKPSGESANPADGSDPEIDRDKYPCPVGGCMTPEMERRYLWERSKEGNSKVEAAYSHACPFYFRHVGPTFSRAVPNSLRFAQCYVTLPAFRAFLEDRGVVVAAPIHQSPEGTESPGESYWYPSYSGYQFIQLPTRAPGTKSFLDPTLTPRWLLARLVRERRHRASQRLPIKAAFTSAETGFLTTPWEKIRRIVSISEGQATLFLLQWLLSRRLLAVIDETGGTAPVDLTRRVEWAYATESESSYAKLAELEKLGYKLNQLFGLEHRNKCYVRVATLEEDLRLLGLVDPSGAVTDRLACAIQWLHARMTWAERHEMEPSDRARTEDTGLGLDEAFVAWLGSYRQFAVEFCQLRFSSPEATFPPLAYLLLSLATEGSLRTSAPDDISWQTLQNIDMESMNIVRARIEHWFSDGSLCSFSSICRLVPEMRILIRAYWPVPLRWLFVPFAQFPALAGRDVQEATISSGLIIMMEDSISGFPYQITGSIADGVDIVLKNLEDCLPLFTFLATCELGYLQDDVVRAYRDWEARRPRYSQAVHFLRGISEDLRSTDGETALQVRGLLNVLAGQFFLQMKPPADDAVRTAETVDALTAAREAVDSYNSYYGPRYCKAGVAFSSAADSWNVAVHPYEQSYSGGESMRQQARYALVFLLLDLLAQRAPYTKGKPLMLTLSHGGGECVLFSLTVPGDFELEWSHPEDDLTRLPTGRGFSNLFGTALALGAVTAGLRRSSDGAESSIFFSFARGAEYESLLH